MHFGFEIIPDNIFYAKRNIFSGALKYEKEFFKFQMESALVKCMSAVNGE